MIYLTGRKVKVQFMLIIIIIVLDMIFWLTKNLHFHSKYLHKPKRGFISIFVLFFCKLYLWIVAINVYYLPRAFPTRSADFFKSTEGLTLIRNNFQYSVEA